MSMNVISVEMLLLHEDWYFKLIPNKSILNVISPGQECDIAIAIIHPCRCIFDSFFIHMRNMDYTVESAPYVMVFKLLNKIFSLQS